MAPCAAGSFKKAMRRRPPFMSAPASSKNGRGGATRCWSITKARSLRGAAIAVCPKLRGPLLAPAGRHPLKAARVDVKLVKALKAAHDWQLKLKASPLSAQADLASAQVHPDSYIRQLGHLAFLAPDIQQAILDGHQPAGLTVKRLLACKVPLGWAAQRTMLGFAR